MIRRNGFVSNSSSSSFVIVTKKKLNKDLLTKAFKEYADKEIIEYLCMRCNCTIEELVDATHCREEATWAEAICAVIKGEYAEPELTSKILDRIRDKRSHSYLSGYCDECGGIEALLTPIRFKIIEDDIIFYTYEGRS